MRAALAAGFTTVLVLVGCGSSEQPAAPIDAAVADTTEPMDTRVRDSAVIDVGPDAGKSYGGTTGKECTTSDDCDVTNDGVNVCSADWFNLGPLNPTPICFGTECDPGPDENGFVACDEGKGWCVDYGSGTTRCHPSCWFETNSTKGAVGCAGRNVCNWLGWSEGDGGKVWAVGFCFGGCTADADCPTGSKCQREFGECVKPVNYWVATKALGDPCTAVDRGTSTKRPNCACWMNSTVGKGYCSQFCRTGESSCPDGFTCDPQLPATSTVGAGFTAAAAGISGGCFKNCTTDAECEPLGGYCEQGVGTGRKTCQFGVRSGTTTDAGTD